MVKVCRARGPLSSAEALGPEVLGLATAGAPGPANAEFWMVGPVAGTPWEASGSGGWRITGEETSSWGGRTTGSWAALRARASRSRFSRSSSDTVLGLGRGPHGAGGGACGVDSARPVCSPPLLLQLELFAASWEDTFCKRLPEGGQNTLMRSR